MQAPLYDAKKLSVLYVSPLKALNEDIKRNLLIPLAAIKTRFEKEALPFPPIRVQTRSGDTPQSERRLFYKSPPSILALTPESLAILLLNPKGRQALSNVRYLIIDEIHAVLGNKRGAFLSCQIDRLTAVAGEFQRISLSATVRNPQIAAEFTGGIGRKVHIIAPHAEKQIDFSVEYPNIETDEIDEVSIIGREGSRYTPLINYVLKRIWEGTQKQHGEAVLMNNAERCSPNESPNDREGGFASANPAGVGSLKGPIVKFLSEEKQTALKKNLSLKNNDTLFFIADAPKLVDGLAGQIRTELGTQLNLINKDKFELCFIVDFPMYGKNEETGAVEFTHNPFSMPQGGITALETKDPLDILAWQYDIVCNGVELSSGAVRNHLPEVMVKAFQIAGYTQADIENKFPALYNAFHYGAPPHAGMAPGLDRIVMLLTEEENIREVVAFPMNSNAQDLLMEAPCEVTEQQLREVHIRVRQPK